MESQPLINQLNVEAQFLSFQLSMKWKSSVSTGLLYNEQLSRARRKSVKRHFNPVIVFEEACSYKLHISTPGAYVHVCLMLLTPHTLSLNPREEFFSSLSQFYSWDAFTLLLSRAKYMYPSSVELWVSWDIFPFLKSVINTTPALKPFPWLRV